MSHQACQETLRQKAVLSSTPVPMLYLIDAAGCRMKAGQSSQIVACCTSKLCNLTQVYVKAVRLHAKTWSPLAAMLIPFKVATFYGS